EVVLPPELRGRTLTLVIPYFRTLAELHANGEEALSLETSITARYAAPGWHAWHIPARLTGGPTLKLELGVDHRTVFSARIGTVPRLSASAAGDPVYFFVRNFNQATLIGSLGIGALLSFIHVVSFLFDHRRRAQLWF